MFQLAVGQIDLMSVPPVLSSPFMSQIDGSSSLRVSMCLLCMNNATEFCCDKPESVYLQIMQFSSAFEAFAVLEIEVRAF